MKYDLTKFSCCAWCHWLYIKETGKPIIWLNPSEYAEFESHGICKECQDAAFIEAAL